MRNSKQRRISRFLAAGVAVILCATVLSTASAASALVGQTCSGLPITVDIAAGDAPTPQDDVIRGTSGDDVIDGLGGNDIICGLGGDDAISGGDGFDKIFAGSGNDILSGGKGNDRLVGGPGDDTVDGGRGNDRLLGGSGNDLLDGGWGNDRVSGGPGNDHVHGNGGQDTLYGNLGADHLHGGPGDDIIRGGAWRDTIDGGTGFDDQCGTDGGERVDNCEHSLFRVRPEPRAVFNPVKSFRIEGAEVTTRTPLNDVPQAASVVEHNGFFIDNGNGGVEACIGSVNDSSPPQCGGPIVDGLEFTPAWGDYYASTTVGNRAVVFTWPPVDGHVTLISERLYERQIGSLEMPTILFPLPDSCVGIETYTSLSVLRAWGETHPDQYAGVLMSDKGRVPTMRVVGDLEAVRVELTLADVEPCLVPADFTSAALAEGRENLRSVYSDPAIHFTGVGTSRNRITVYLASADRYAVAALVKLVDDPAMLHISGGLTIIK